MSVTMTVTKEELMNHPWFAMLQNLDTLTKISKETYITKLTHLISELKYTGPEQVLQNPKQVCKHVINRYKAPSTRKIIFASITAMIKHNNLAETYEESAALYRKWVKQLNSHLYETSGSGVMTEREIKTYIPWGDVKKKLLTMAAAEKPGEVSKGFLLLACYTLIPPLRQDFGDVQLLAAEPSPDFKGNYIVINNVKSILVLNQWKNASRKGRIIIKLPDNLASLIKLSIRSDPRLYLFESKPGVPYSCRRGFTNFSNQTLSNIFGKHTTVTSLRHSFISSIDYNTTSAVELHRIARAMGHSVSLQLFYRRKVPSESTQ
jgi:hypothetical protein